jgi:hypothetical protein
VDYELIKPDAQDAYDPAPFLNYARLRRTDRQERDPDVGDSVHFWDMVEARCLAAIVLEDDPLEDQVSLRVMAAHVPDQDRCEVPHDETKTGPSWHWPCGGN